MSKRKKPKPPGRKKPEPEKLSAMEARFVAKVLELDNVTQAYIDAGHPTCSRPAAAANGQRLLRIAKVRAAVDKGLELLGQKAEIGADEAMARISAIATFDPRMIYDAKGGLLPVHLWPDGVALCVKSIDPAGKVSFDSRLTALLTLAEAGGRIKRKQGANITVDHVSLLADFTPDPDGKE